MGVVNCLDTHVLIWGVKQQAKPSQQHMIERTSNFIQWMENERHTVVVPAPILGEFLMNIPPANHSAITSVFAKRFVIAPYDARAAAIFATIWQKNGKMYRNRVKDEPTREEVKVDCMLVAVAMANNASVLYSEDPHVHELAAGFVTVREIPQIPTQTKFEFSS